MTTQKCRFSRKSHFREHKPILNTLQFSHSRSYVIDSKYFFQYFQFSLSLNTMDQVKICQTKMPFDPPLAVPVWMKWWLISAPVVIPSCVNIVNTLDKRSNVRKYTFLFSISNREIRVKCLNFYPQLYLQIAKF